MVNPTAYERKRQAAQDAFHASLRDRDVISPITGLPECSTAEADLEHLRLHAENQAICAHPMLGAVVTFEAHAVPDRRDEGEIVARIVFPCWCRDATQRYMVARVRISLEDRDHCWLTGARAHINYWLEELEAHVAARLVEIGQ